MAREVVIWCDPCQEQEERSEGQEFTLTIDRFSRRIAVCEVHEKEIVTPLREMLERVGQQPDEGARPSTRPTTRRRSSSSTPTADLPDVGLECKFPGCGDTSISEAGMKQHLYGRHDKLSVPRYREFLAGKAFTQAELERHAKVADRTEFICRVDPENCQNTYTLENSTKPKGSFSGHLRKTHDLSFEEAEEKVSSAP